MLLSACCGPWWSLPHSAFVVANLIILSEVLVCCCFLLLLLSDRILFLIYHVIFSAVYCCEFVPSVSFVFALLRSFFSFFSFNFLIFFSSSLNMSLYQKILFLVHPTVLLFYYQWLYLNRKYNSNRFENHQQTNFKQR